jgi:hypothetical protein
LENSPESPKSRPASPQPSERGPLRAIILASTGEDIGRCTHCDLCEKYLKPGMDLTIGELMQSATRDEDRALSSRTLWLADDLLGRSLRCQAGLDLESVMLVLQREAIERGFGPPPDDRR